MGATGRDRADHASYISAVRRRLEAREVHVITVSLSGHSGRRTALLLLGPDDAAAITETGFRDATVTWDEENGWSLAARRDTEAIAAGDPVYKGLGVIPDPDDVAAWAVVLLAHPELTPSREDHPFRDCSVHDPAFEESLARYAATV
jgi:hypothetical protein